MNRIGKRKKEKKNAGSSGARRLPPSTITAGAWSGMCPVLKTSKLSAALLHWAVWRLFFFHLELFSLRTIAISSRRPWHAEAAIIVVIAAAVAAAAEIGRRLGNSVA